MSDIQRLRDEAKGAHRAAGNKVSRLRTVKGVEMSGTKYDVRRDPEKIKRYNRTQLKNYINELHGFTNRRNNYVAGSAGTPIPATLWNQYKAAEAQFNARGAAKFESVKDVYLPGLGKTIGEHTDDMSKKVARRTAGGMAYRPYSALDKRAAGVPGVKELLKSLKAINKKTATDFDEKTLAKQKRNALKYVRKLGDKEMTHRVSELNPQQFDFLWNYTPFASEAKPKYLKYLVESKRMRPDDLSTAVSQETDVETLYDLITLAELPTEDRNNAYKPRNTPKGKRKPNDPRAVGKITR